MTDRATSEPRFSKGSLCQKMTRTMHFDVSDNSIHEFATNTLLCKEDMPYILAQGKYAYRVKSGDDGYLYYKKGTGENWILIANWCFYRLYIAVRYRKPLWLRPMYRSLFAKMNFVSIVFNDHSIEIVGLDGESLKGRRFRLSPPSAFVKVMTEKFGYSVQKAEDLKLRLNLPLQQETC